MNTLTLSWECIVKEFSSRCNKIYIFQSVKFKAYLDHSLCIVDDVKDEMCEIILLDTIIATQEGLHERDCRRDFNQYITLRDSIAAVAIDAWKDTLNLPKKIAIFGVKNIHWDNTEKLRLRLYPKKPHSTFFKQKNIVDDLLNAISLYNRTVGNVIQQSIQHLYTKEFHFDRLGQAPAVSNDYSQSTMLTRLHLVESGTIGQTIVQVEEDRDLALALTSSRRTMQRIENQSALRGDQSEYSIADVILPKGISATPVGTFRVQYNSRITRSKFTKNVSIVDDALWLFEIALLICDKPPTLEKILQAGNYQFLLKNGFTRNPVDYEDNLRKVINQFSKTRILNLHQVDEAMRVLTILTEERLAEAKLTGDEEYFYCTAVRIRSRSSEVDDVLPDSNNDIFIDSFEVDDVLRDGNNDIFIDLFDALDDGSDELFMILMIIVIVLIYYIFYY